MALKPLSELLFEAEQKLEAAENLHNLFPSTKSAIALFEATNYYESANDLLHTIMVDEKEEKPKKKPSLNKRKRNRNVRILEDNCNS